MIPGRVEAGDRPPGGSVPDGAHRAPAVLPLAPLWTIDIDGQPVARAAPVFDDERVYVALRAGQIVARSLVDGTEKWRKDLPTDQPITTDQGIVFVASRDAIHALRGADGATLWEMPLPNITAPLVARGGWLIVLAGRRAIALRSKDGVRIWERDVGGSIEPPAIDGDRVYVSVDDGRIVAAHITTGESIWESAIGATAGPLFALGDRIYAGASDRLFYCLKAQDGEIAWTKRIGAAVLGSAAVDEEHVYFVALDNVIRGLDRSNGNQRWQHAYRRRALTGPATGGRYVFVASSSSPDIWMWTFDGKPAGSLTLPSAPAVPPAFIERAGGMLDVVAVTGNLAGQWQLTLLTKAGEPPLLPLSTAPGIVLEEEMLPDPPLVPLTGLPGLLLDPEVFHSGG